ncbi:hypothetical protein [Hymenobacter sp. PAMC 26628]|uniref:hypothetical protein n=1 Tax=Hymenobacter sp. PAMC 26628 TaxID=1484118 RepID=UPI0012FF9DEE|nr:hypothetical protein [Hymenobacter sp. PAMC 26628]
MIYALNYLSRCFYQLTAVEKPDRTGTSRTLLSLFLLFLLLDVYTLASLILDKQPHFVPAALCCFVLAQLAVRTYARHPVYQQQLATYTEFESKRLRLALTGAGALLAVCFMPFLLMHYLS